MNIRVFLLAFLLLTILLPTAYARSVSMNFAFNIGGDKSDTIRTNGTDFSGSQTSEITFPTMDKKFVSSERNGKVFGLAFAGSEFLNIHINTSYSSSEYLLRMTQEAYNNRFLLAFTSGTWNNIDAHAKDAEDFRLISRTFGNIVLPVAGTFFFFMRLEYQNADIHNKTVMNGPVKLLIRNQGRIGNIFNISAAVI